jgi:hypothetical protein
MLSHVYLNVAIWGPHPVGLHGFSRFFCPSEAEGDKKNGPEALLAMPMVHGIYPWELTRFINHENWCFHQENISL